MTKMEPKSSRTVKGKIISHSVGKFQDGDKPISQDLLLSDEEIDLVIKKSTKDKEEFWMAEDALELVAKAQLQHLIDLGWKSPEEVEALIAQVNQCHMSITDLKRQLQELEQAIKDERAKVLKEIAEIGEKESDYNIKSIILGILFNLKQGKG